MSSNNATITFRIEFDRIGARNEVPPLLATVETGEPHLVTKLVEEEVLRYARPKLGSRGVQVSLAAGAGPGQASSISALDGSTGGLSIGWGRPAGSFSIRIDRPNEPPYIHRALPKQPREAIRRSACGLAVTPGQAAEQTARITCPRCVEIAAHAASGSQR